MQIVKICLADLHIINIYRSKEEPLQSVVHHLQQIISRDIDTLLFGDLNYCYSGQNNLSRYLHTIEKFGLYNISYIQALIKGKILPELSWI